MWRMFAKCDLAWYNIGIYCVSSEECDCMAKDTELIFIVDKSGSMSGLEDDTVGGINATLDANRQGEGDVYVSVVFFDTNVETFLDHVLIDDVAPIVRDDYRPGGMTALLDAVGVTLDAVKERVMAQKKSKRPRVIVAIITDGAENSSREYKYEDIKKRVDDLGKKGFEFLFLGANIDAIGTASNLGISVNRASAYVADSVGTAVAYEAMAKATASYRRTGAVLDSWSDDVSADAATRG